MSIHEIKALVNSVLYQSVITDIQRATSIKIAATKCKNQKTEDIVFGLQLRNLTNVGLSIQEIKDCLVIDREALIQYSVKKHHLLYGVIDPQEYPNGEDVEAQSEGTSQGYSSVFVIMNAIEYRLAKQGKAVLESYLQKTRIPFAKKYAKQILTQFML